MEVTGTKLIEEIELILLRSIIERGETCEEAANHVYALIRDYRITE